MPLTKLQPPPCGITFNELSLGNWEFTFNFEVNDRFWAATLDNVFNGTQATLISVGSYPGSNDTLLVVTTDTGLKYQNANFSLIVF